MYPIFLKNGNLINAGDQTELLRCFADATGLGRGVSRNSFAPILASVNYFFRLSQDLADEANEIAKGLDPSITNKYDLVIGAINGDKTISAFEKKRLQQNSMLGGVLRICGPLQRPLRLRSPSERNGQVDDQRQNFPLSGMAAVLEAATCWRDKALWALLMATGIRKSEALNLRLEHIDPTLQTVRVEDPNLLRFGREQTAQEDLKFKGRKTSKTIFFEPLKSVFFRYFEKYLKEEFICTDEHDFVFQIVEKRRRGAPLHTASDTAINKSFKKAVLRAGISGPPNQPGKVWTLHSLRHAYGVYMLNYVPVQGGFGLRPTEVQMAMGHRSLDSTMQYARHAEVLLDAKMLFASNAIYESGGEIQDLTVTIGNQFIAAGTAILAGTSKI